MKRLFKKLILGVVFGILFLPSFSLAEDAIHLQIKEKEGIFLLDGEFFIEANPTTAWEVLSDYDNIETFVSSMQKSEVLERKGNSILLQQEGMVKVLLFSDKIHLLLKVTETPKTEITFQDTLHKDFRLYEGSWKIKKNNHRLFVLYHLRVKPRSYIFVQLGLTKAVNNLLKEVRAEIIRRSPRNQ